MELLQFVKSLPQDFVLAPIYRKGATMRSGKAATGKNPHESGHERNLDSHDAALIIEKTPSIGAIGLWTGIRGKGLVILDVDRSLGALSGKWGKSLDGAPVITSTKRNAAKYLFRVPEELWRDVAGKGLREDTGHAYEILWGRQGLIFGEYPGSSDGKAPEGFYGFEGDLEAIPDAPGWLIAEMKAAKAGDAGSYIKNRTALDVSDRTEDEVAAIVQECLNVVGNQGVGSREHWIRIGMAIHSVLPNEVGLELWSTWSKRDAEYHQEWEAGNPCQEPWNSFKPGRIGLGSLIFLADQVDPKRARFTKSSLQILEASEARVVQEVRTAVLTHAEIVTQAKEILDLDNPSEINHRMNGLAIAAGYRDRSAVEALLLSQLEYERKEQSRKWQELRVENFEKSFLIPDVLPHPSVVLLYGAGGDGKSMTAWTLAKHISMGLPFTVRGKLMPVKQGPVLILNGDQNLGLLKEQLEEIDMPADAPVVIQQGWQLKRYNEFCKLIDKHKPAMVVIDSLIGCSSGDAFDENKSEFASPLYWLSKNNGVMFPRTTIVIIHHANKTGGFRGTSAIRDAVDETWALKKPDGGVNSLPANCRLINIEKSRAGRGGTSLIMQMEADLTFSVSDYMPEVDETKTTPDKVIDRVLMRIRSMYPRSVTKAELIRDPLVGGNVDGIRKALQRLTKRGLIKAEALPGKSRSPGKPTFFYQAILKETALARGEGEESVPFEQTPSAGTDDKWDNQMGQADLSHLPNQMGQPGAESGGCPIYKASEDKGSAQMGQPDKYPRARSEDEINAAIDQTFWDDEPLPTQPVESQEDRDRNAFKTVFSLFGQLRRGNVEDVIDIEGKDV